MELLKVVLDVEKAAEALEPEKDVFVISEARAFLYAAVTEIEYLRSQRAADGETPGGD